VGKEENSTENFTWQKRGTLGERGKKDREMIGETKTNGEERKIRTQGPGRPEKRMPSTTVDRESALRGEMEGGSAERTIGGRKRKRR